LLDPAAGDVAALYDTVDVLHPVTGAWVKALAHKPNGGPCVYLGADGCTIHDHAPTQCRAFDCRLYYLDLMAKPRPERRRELRATYSAEELFEAGRALQERAPVDAAEIASPATPLLSKGLSG